MMRLTPKPLAIPRRYRTPILLCGSALALTTAVACLPLFAQANPTTAIAQAEPPEGDAGAAEKAKKPKPRPVPVKPAAPKPEAAQADKPKPDAAKPAAPASAPPASLAGAAAAGANTAALNVSAKLMQNGVGACASSIDAEAVPSMVGVTESNTVSLWSNVEPRAKHAASVFIGQRYGANPAVPYGVTGLISSQTPSGSCDVTVVQVVASPLPCGKVRETLARNGRVLGELAGLPLVQSGDGQTLMMPTATNTCVLVAFRSKFGE